MVFVEGGRVVDRRSMMRVGTISEFFWAALNSIFCFFHSMINVSYLHPAPMTASTAPLPSGSWPGLRPSLAFSEPLTIFIKVRSHLSSDHSPGTGEKGTQVSGCQVLPACPS
ncbi:hypothetical protein T484DRAFT_3352710 [Baffinella frigidus]|nr:hypothetical protein T484DRAFT_3352710 [Cryptophyta sp. CCMP2293]